MEFIKVFNIVMSFNSEKIEEAKKTIHKLLKNNEMRMNIYLIYNNLSKEEILELKKIISKRKNVKLIPKKVKIKGIPQGFKEEECYKLIVQDVLPKTENRALWIDYNKKIDYSLYDFYVQLFNDKYIIAFDDIYMDENEEKQNLNRLGLDEDGVYFDLGLALFNLKELRKNIKIDDYFKFLENTKLIINNPERDAINVLLNNKIKHMLSSEYYGAKLGKNKNQKNHMNVIVSFDSNYLNLGQTMLLSLMQNNKNSKIAIYLLYSNLQDGELAKIKKLINKFKNANINFIEIQKDKYKKFFTTSDFPIEACYRLIIQEELPKDVDRALWLDSDIIVRKSIQEFYNQSFLDNYCVACEDMSMVTDKINSNLERLKINKEIYFNSGVLLLNLKKIRKDFSIDKYFEFMQNNEKILCFPDQDTINVLYKGKIKHNCCYLYNSYMSSHFIYKNKKEKNKIKKCSKIFHYIAKENKPTKAEFNNFGFDEFWKYGKKIYGYKKYLNIKIKNKIYKISKGIR